MKVAKKTRLLAKLGPIINSVYSDLIATFPKTGLNLPRLGPHAWQV